MFCTYCKSARPNNEAACPHCGAPSSQAGQPQDRGWGIGEPATSPNQQWNYQEPQLTFDAPAPSWQQNSPIPQSSFDAPVPSWQQVSPASQSMPPQQSWGASTATQVQNQQPQAQQWPVPYTGNMQGEQQPASMQLVPVRDQGQMLPALPNEQDAAGTVYIPPMYTKPRPIIPLYRIISGLLSIIVVTVLLCGGSIYYANATGKLVGLQRLVGAAPAAMTDKPAVQIPDPPDKVDTGPAATIITAAATTLRIDPNSHAPREQDKIFQVGVPFYITFSAKSPKPGYVIIKWYMNGQYYTTTPSDLINQTSISGDRQMTYSVPAESTAELYWQNQGGTPQLAQRLYFAVR